MEFDTLSSELNLKEDFPANEWKDWLKAVEDTLKGVPFEKTMITKTYEGIDLQPIYRLEDLVDIPHLANYPGQAPYVRGNSASGYRLNSWKIAQQQNACNPQEANAIILDELNRGLTAVNIRLDSTVRDGKQLSTTNPDADGVVLGDLEDISVLLNGIDLNAVPLMLETGQSQMAILGLVKAYCESQGFPTAKLNGLVGFDPFSELAINGSWQVSVKEMFDGVFAAAQWADTEAPQLRTLLLDGSVWGSAGADSVSELAYLLAMANDYLQKMPEGMTVDELAPRFQMNLTLGSNLFMEIAKVRAARLLWAELIKAYGGSEASRKIWIHGITSSYNKTIYDPFVNVLRSATESFSAVIGGVDSLEVIPFDAMIRPDAEFSRRIARNQQIILQEEAHLDKVIDPSGGCYCIEKLTAQIAQAAWQKMQGIVAQGGFLQALVASIPQIESAKMAAQRSGNVEKRKDVVIGVNMFANLSEQPLEQPANACTGWLKEKAVNLITQQKSERPELDKILNLIQSEPHSYQTVGFVSDAWKNQGTLSEIHTALQHSVSDISVQTISLTTAMHTVEHLRSCVQEHNASNPKELKVFLANMGPIIQHKPRADFALNFFQVGGFKVINNDGFEVVEAAIEAAIASDAQAVCLCSTDDTYPELVPQVITKLKSLKPDLICLLAGYPTDMVETYKTQGVDLFIHLRANCLEVLTTMATKMGVQL